MKTCSVCGESKSVALFYAQRGTKDGLKSECKECTKTRVRAYRAAHREEHRQAQREYVKANRDKVSASAAKRRSDPVNREKMREYQAEWYQRNSETLRARAAQWKRDNPDKVLSHYNNRRARVKEAFVEHIDHNELAERDAWICGICLGQVPREEWSLDHIIPLSKGGTHSWDNVQLAHKRCNSSKGTRLTGTRRQAVVAYTASPWPPLEWRTPEWENSPEWDTWYLED